MLAGRRTAAGGQEKSPAAAGRGRIAGMRFTEEQKRQITADAIDKTVESLEWEEDGGYWVMTFTDGSEISFRFMAELQG